MFVDNIELKVIAGNGGDGCTSFRREKCVPLGGPNGGNGGRGSNIIFKVDKGLKTLIDLRYQKIIKGKKGENGKGSNRNGANADDIIIKVPEGTTVYDADTNLVLVDLVDDKAEFIVAHGGRGGRGNKAFATQSEPAPKFSEFGEPGEKRILRCELKVLADVGLIGLPSVGKSTILSCVSGANPKIASYHFTTLSPNLGVVKIYDKSFVMADLPGLIEGASKGAGLGKEFLRHAMRTKVLAHVIDMGASEERNPIEDYQIIRKEIDSYNKVLANKKEIVIANKMDLKAAQNNLKEFKKVYPEKEIIEISALNNEGLNKLVEKLMEIVENTTNEKIYDEEDYESYVVYKFKQEAPYTITKEDGIWTLKGKEIEKLFRMTKFNEDEAVLRFARKLRGMGVEEALEKAGAKRGDEVQIEGYVFEFKE